MFVITRSSQFPYILDPGPILLLLERRILFFILRTSLFRGSLYQVSRQTRREIPPWFTALEYKNPLRMWAKCLIYPHYSEDANAAQIPEWYIQPYWTSQKLLLIGIHTEEFFRHVQQSPGAKTRKAYALASHWSERHRIMRTIPAKILCELLWITKENSLQTAHKKRDINEME